MKTISQFAKIIEQRVRDKRKILHACQKIDRLFRKAPPGWDSVEIIRQMREARR